MKKIIQIVALGLITATPVAADERPQIRNNIRATLVVADSLMKTASAKGDAATKCATYKEALKQYDFADDEAVRHRTHARNWANGDQSVLSDADAIVDGVAESQDEAQKAVAKTCA